MTDSQAVSFFPRDHMEKNLRNFAILAHVDHGKSTLADRMLEITGTVEKRKMREQYLDQLELERERGITIKMAPVRMKYEREIPNPKSQIPNKFQIPNSKFQIPDSKFILNLIDTPGHSDFSYEVSRALAAVEGVILLVDATQGIQAQTLAKFEAAKKAGLKIIGAVGKIDLNPPSLDATIKATAELIGVSPEEISSVSGKTGEGVRDLLEAVIKKIPPPKDQIRNSKFEIRNFGRALIFDSFYDDHKGIIASVRVFDGNFSRGDAVKFLAADGENKIKELGYFGPELRPAEELKEGEIGYIVTGIKNPDLIKIGDTVITENQKSKIKNQNFGVAYSDLFLKGYQEPQPLVFVSFYPQDADEYDHLKQALARLRLNDSSLFYEPDQSELLGRGFKCGFLGQLHFEITAERLTREFKVDTIQSFPSVVYQVIDGLNRTYGTYRTVNSPKDFPDEYLEAREPIAAVEIISPPAYLGNILALRQIFRFSDFQTENLGERLLIKARLPLADLISDLDDKLKSISEGMASLSYQLAGYEPSDLAKVEILIAGHLISGLTRILPQEKIDYEARRMLEKLKELLPRRQFAQALQARASGRIIARETISALRKDVTGYLYGGDRTRKMKLWKKQQKGKAKLKERSQKNKIDVPSSVFRELLKK